MSKVKLNWNWLYLLFFGRVLTAATFFMYVGSMSFLIQEWNLSATNAGIIQTGPKNILLACLHCTAPCGCYVASLKSGLINHFPERFVINDLIWTFAWRGHSEILQLLNYAF